MMRSKIKEVSNVYIDMFDIITNRDNSIDEYVNLHSWQYEKNLEDSTFGQIVCKLQEFLESYNYKIIHAYNMVDIPIDTITGDVVGKFFIIKNEDVFLDRNSSKPLTVYVKSNYNEPNIIGKIIGTGGSNIKSIKSKLNESNEFWNVPYIKVNKIEERTINNNQEELNKKFLELLDIIF